MVLDTAPNFPPTQAQQRDQAEPNLWGWLGPALPRGAHPWVLGVPPLPLPSLTHVKEGRDLCQGAAPSSCHKSRPRSLPASAAEEHFTAPLIYMHLLHRAIL